MKVCDVQGYVFVPLNCFFDSMKGDEMGGACDNAFWERQIFTKFWSRANEGTTLLKIYVPV